MLSTELSEEAAEPSGWPGESPSAKIETFRYFKKWSGSAGRGIQVFEGLVFTGRLLTARGNEGT